MLLLGIFRQQYSCNWSEMVSPLNLTDLKVSMDTKYVDMLN